MKVSESVCKSPIAGFGCGVERMIVGKRESMSENVCETVKESERKGVFLVERMTYKERERIRERERVERGLSDIGVRKCV